MFNLDGPSRELDNDARRSPRKPPSPFRFTSLFSSQATTVTAGPQSQEQDDSWILATGNEPWVALDDMGSPFKCDINYSPPRRGSEPSVEEAQNIIGPRQLKNGWPFST